MKLSTQEKIAENLKKLMEEKGHRYISDFAKEIDIPVRTINDWINGRKMPRLDSAKTLADYFEISLDEFFD